MNFIVGDQEKILPLRNQTKDLSLGPKEKISFRGPKTIISDSYIHQIQRLKRYLLATLELTTPAPLVNVLCVVHPNEERIGSYPMGRKMNRFQGEINHHILHKKMPNFQICSSNKKKFYQRSIGNFLATERQGHMYIIGETISSSDRNF